MSATHAVLLRDAVVTANGRSFHYRAWGDASNPPLLVLHGLTGHSWEFDDLAVALADRFHVLAVDQRGHGASDWAESYAAEHLAGDLHAIVGALGQERVSVIGHSMGAIATYLWAAQHPEMLDRFVLLDVGPDTLEPGALTERITAALAYWATAVYPTQEDAVAEYLDGATGETADVLQRFVLNNLRAVDGGWTWRFDAARLTSFLTDSPSSQTQWEALARLQARTLIVHAADSEALSAETAARMARVIPDSTLVTIHSSGHDVHIDQFDALLSEVRVFLLAA